MRYYPLLLELSDKRCLVVGAGRVGCRKIRALLKADPAEILVLDPAGLHDEELARHPRVHVEQRQFRPADVTGCSLVFAATPVREVNATVASACRAHHVWCNVADAPPESDFIVPAHIESGSLILALSSCGASPALVKALREDLEKWLGERYARLVCLLDRLRPQILALELGSDADAELFRTLCARPTREPLTEALNTHDSARAETLLREVLPPVLHSTLAELLHECN